jgi:hypothetical protein
VKELQGFLGVINFYCRFIPAATHILQLLTDQLKGASKPAAIIPWAEAMQAAFAAAKAPLAGCVRLIHLLPGARFLYWWTPQRTTLAPPCNRGPTQQLHGDLWDSSPGG